MTKEFACRALEMALNRRRPGRGLIHHSDRGSQYASGAYQDLLASRGIIPSMSRKGDCWDNAPMESFFHTLKVELVHHRDYRTREEARGDIIEYMEMFYNWQRRHSSLGYATPAEYEMVPLAKTA
jgi:transposase InsO family protein